MGIQKVSEQIVELGVRMSDVADAAQGKRSRRRAMTRWLFFVPAAGAGLYALGRSDSFARQARGVMDGAKARATELPDDLLNRVRQTSQTSQASPSSNGSARRRRTTRKTRSTRKSAARS